MNKEEISAIKTEIENGNIRNQKDVDSRIEEHLDKQGHDNSVNIDDEIRKTNGSDALVDSRPPQREPIGELGDSSGKENLGTGQVKMGFDCKQIIRTTINGNNAGLD